MEAGVCHGKATGLHGWASDPCAAFHLFGSRHDRRGPGGQSLCSACWHNCRSCHYAPATWCLAEQPRLMPVWGHPSFAVAYSAGHWSQGVQRHGLGQIGMETGSGGHLLVGARQRQRRWQDRHCCTGCTHLAEGKAGQLVAEWWAGAGLQAAAAAGAAPALCCMAHCTSPRHAAWQEGHMWHPSAACNSAAAADTLWSAGWGRGCRKGCLEWRTDCHRNHVCRKDRKRGSGGKQQRASHSGTVPRLLHSPLLLLLLLWRVAARRIHPRVWVGRHEIRLWGSSAHVSLRSYSRLRPKQNWRNRLSPL